MALARAMRILRLGVALGKPPLRGVPPRHSQLSYYPMPLRARGDINTAFRTFNVWENPHWGVRPDQTQYGCAGPILTKDQFRSRCVRAGIFYKTPREELSR